MAGTIRTTMVGAAPLFFCFYIAACDGGGGSSGDDWRVEAPEQHGLSTSALDSATDRIGRIGSRQCATVIKNGVLVHDKNFSGSAGSQNAAYSVTKTFGAALVGIAVTQGFLTVDDPVTKWVPRPTGDISSGALVRHVLGQTSESNPPGSRFSYNSGAVINTLSEVVTAATGMGADEYARINLLEPVGMNDTTWNGDSRGNVPFGAGIRSSCRDIAKLGLLLLNKGVWDGKQIISSEYVSQMTRPSYPAANSAYGYLTWLNADGGNWRRPVSSGSGKMVKNAPANMYAATGFFGQLIIVIPDDNMVVTTMGTTVQVETLDTLREVWDAILPALP